jgi:anaerobic selenocysteine-containing dehydrogenase
MLVEVQDGRAVAVAGDPDHPLTAGFLCGKVSNYTDRVYADDRLLHPLIRTGPKGAAQFREATWEEALDAAADGIGAAVERYGGEALLPYSYMGTMGLLQGGSMGHRLMNALGASDLVRTICASAGVRGVDLTIGRSPEVDPDLWQHARTIVAWGWNPMSTAPHLWRKILEARRAGARLVVVDPFRSRTARVADEHLTPLPGTDAALALGMMRAIVDAGLADDEWCRAHADGYDDLLARLGEYPVEHWAGRCGVPADQIAAVAREFAISQPALLRLGIGAQRHAGAPIAYRTVACLPALVGAWRHVGGGLSYVPRFDSGIDEMSLVRSDLRPGPVRSLNMSQLGGALTDPELDPPVAALVVWNSNPAAIAPDQEAVLRGLARDDLFTVVLEQFMTDTARHADVVFPATTQLEHLDVVGSWGHHYLTYNAPAIAPVGEAKPNTETFRLLAGRLGLTDPAFAETDEEMLHTALASMDGAEELPGRGWVKLRHGLGDAPHAEGRFGTPSGKVALHSARLADDGSDPLPWFEEPAEVGDADLAARFPLALITPKTHLFLNSTFPNQRRQHSAQPEPFVVLHPDDAKARALSDGEVVRVGNDRGSFVAPLRVSADARAGVAVAPMGWWNADYDGARSPQATTPQRLTDIGAAPTFNDNRVEVSAADAT